MRSVLKKADQIAAYNTYLLSMGVDDVTVYYVSGTAVYYQYDDDAVTGLFSRKHHEWESFVDSLTRPGVY